MRRGVDMNFLAGGLQDRARERDRGALAVGARDMDDRRKMLMRRAEIREQPFDPAQREIDEAGMQRREPGRDGIRG